MVSFSFINQASIGAVTNIIGPQEMRFLRSFTMKISRAYQPELEDVLEHITTELNKYGFDLDMVDFQEHPEKDLEHAGTAYISIKTFATKEAIKNAYLRLSWERLSSGQQFYYRPEALNYSVDLQLREVGAADIDAIFTKRNNVTTTDE